MIKKVNSGSPSNLQFQRFTKKMHRIQQRPFSWSYSNSQLLFITEKGYRLNSVTGKGVQGRDQGKHAMRCPVASPSGVVDRAHFFQQWCVTVHGVLPILPECRVLTRCWSHNMLPPHVTVLSPSSSFRGWDDTTWPMATPLMTLLV